MTSDVISKSNYLCPDCFEEGENIELRRVNRFLDDYPEDTKADVQFYDCNVCGYVRYISDNTNNHGVNEEIRGYMRNISERVK